MSRFTTLFPPILENYIPAFDAVTNYETATVRFYFTPSIANNITQARSLMLRFRRVNTNTNPLPINTYPYEVMWFSEESFVYDKESTKHYVEIPVKTFLSPDAQTESPSIPNYFKGIDEFYKLQMRFSPYRVRKEDEFSGRWEYLLPEEEIWVAMNSNFMINGYGKFSEWSSACLVKPISPPKLTLLGFEGFQNDIQDWYLDSIPTAVFNFTGSYTTKDASELLKSYRFQVISYDYTQFSEQGPDNNKVIEDSGWKLLGEYDALNINWTNRIQFENKKKYWIRYEIETVNGFNTSVYYLIEPNFVSFPVSINLNVVAVPDLAKVEVRLDTSLIDSTKVNKLSILRTSSRSGDESYDELVCFEITKPGVVKYSDYFIESGVKYKYYVQPIGIDGNRGGMTEYQEVIVDYDYSWLIGENFTQASIEYNGTISAMKRVRRDTVIETIGGKFPVVASNSNVGYLDMTYSCTLTQHMDKENLFGGSYSEIFGGLKDETADDYYQINLANKVDSYDENYITEREFRNKFQDWIQDGKARVYKSNTEGLVLVRVVDFVATPVQQLGRLISNASFRMVEIGALTHDNLVQFGLKKSEYTDEELREIYDRSKPYPSMVVNPALTGYSYVRKDW